MTYESVAEYITKDLFFLSHGFGEVYGGAKCIYSFCKISTSSLQFPLSSNAYRRKWVDIFGEICFNVI